MTEQLGILYLLHIYMYMQMDFSEFVHRKESTMKTSTFNHTFDAR